MRSFWAKKARYFSLQCVHFVSETLDCVNFSHPRAHWKISIKSSWWMILDSRFSNGTLTASNISLLRGNNFGYCFNLRPSIVVLKRRLMKPFFPSKVNLFPIESTHTFSNNIPRSIEKFAGKFSKTWHHATTIYEIKLNFFFVVFPFSFPFLFYTFDNSSYYIHEKL